MKIENFNEVQSAMLDFLEIKRKDTAVSKAKKKVTDKEKALKKAKENEKQKLENNILTLKQNLSEQRKKSLNSEISAWLTESANKAESVNSKASKPMFRNTHPVKFTNPGIEYGGAYVKHSNNSSEFLTTDTLKHQYYDISHSNGNLITHSQFLITKLDTETVYEKLEKSDFTWLESFSKDKNQVQSWGESLRLWTGVKELKNAIGLKQNYFPVDNDYHLLAPLFSSSICQEIYDRVQNSKFNDDVKLMRKAKKDGVYEEGTLISYPDVAKMNFGGLQPQNITARNFVRHGDSYLLSCAAPEWQSVLSPPSTSNLFNGDFNHMAWEKTKKLRNFLLSVQNKDSNKKTRDHVKSLTGEIISVLFNYVAQIQNFKELAGWSKKYKLKKSHKLWLDIHYADETFQQQRESGDWQNEVCRDFGLWLNKKLEHKKMKGKFAKIESDNWAKVLRSKLREFELNFGDIK